MKKFFRFLIIIFLSTIIVMVLLSYFLLTHRHENPFYFQIEDQRIVSCGKRSVIIRLYIENDSVKNGFPYESAKMISWKKTGRAYHEFSLDNIPEGYILTIGGIREYKVSSIKLKPNSMYSIEKSGYGDTPFTIKVWTDSIGRIYKTTHPVCGIKSLE